jgi:ABC-type phosphate/phosphonate transport system substrate-binding protein
MFMRKAMIVAAAATLALAACGRKEKAAESQVTVAPNGQATIRIDGGKEGGGQTATMGTALPANLPAYVKVYPGATVASSVTGTSGGSSGGMIMYQTSATPEAVLAFHKKAAADAGLATTADTAVGQTHSFVASGAAGKNVNVTVARTDNGTFVQMTYD